MTTNKYFFERRKNIRFKVEEAAFVQFLKHPRFKLGKPRVMNLAPIIDISIGGLRFEYNAHEMWPLDCDALTILSASEKIRIDNVSFEAISDFPISKLPDSTTLRRCGVKFKDLLPNQKSSLDTLILEHAMSDRIIDRRTGADRRKEDAIHHNDPEKRSGEERRRSY